eukprot:m.11565 g.11565  ORF g.11565 m.11565 type:complete len:193 (+) comp9845_c0_seq1:303-881(+)
MASSQRYVQIPQTEQAERVELEPIEEQNEDVPLYTPLPNQTITVVLPSYEEVQRIKEREDAVLAPGEPAAVQTNDGATVPVGDDLTFTCTFLLGLLLGWIGLLCTMCIPHSIASRAGASSGFGVWLMAWALREQRIHLLLEEGYLNDDQVPDQPPYSRVAVSVAAMFGFVLFLCGCMTFIQGKALARRQGLM